MFKPKRIQELLPVESLKAGLPKKIESIKEQIYEVSAKRKAGFRDKLVDCEVRLDPNLPEVITIRLDTGAEIARRAMTAEERQEDLFPKEAPNGEAIEGAATQLTTEEERERLNREAVARWKREPAQPVVNEPDTDPAPEIEARANSDDEWDALLDQAEAEMDAEEATKPEWETRPLDYDDYLAYALSTGIKNPASHAQKWSLTGEHESDVRQFLRQQAEAESDPADDFTANQCMECKRLDGAHDQNCTFHPDFALNITPRKTRKGNSVQPRSNA